MSRLAAIDQLRAFAILMMILAHFGEGAVARIPLLAPYMEPLLFLTEVATASFILVFGFTIGFVHYGRFFSNQQAQTKARLRRRFIVVLACALLTFVPNYAVLAFNGTTDINKWIFATYSILNFYVIAFALSAVWLLAIGNKRPVINAAIIGVVLWISGQLLLMIWPSANAETPIEYARINLISGPYAFLQLSGAATFAIAVGILLKAAERAGGENAFAIKLAPLGLLLCLAGIALGVATGELSVHSLFVGDIKHPPRLWYWLFFSGITCMVFSALILIERNIPISRTLLYPLSLFGRAALPIYAMHVFVLPTLYLFDRVYELTGTARVVAPFVAMMLIIALIMYYYHPKEAKNA